MHKSYDQLSVMSKISVITITKDNPEGFARTRESIESQAFRDFEWVVIDGGIEADSGIYDAMNKGLDRATGSHVLFMNAGDVFADSDVLSRIAPHLDFDFIYGDAIEGGFMKRARHNIAHGMPTHHQAMIYKKRERRYDISYQIAADYKFTAEYMMRGAHKYLPFPICVFEQGGVSQRKASLGRKEQRRIRREFGLRAPFAAPTQWAAQTLKTYLPSLYWKLRTRLSTSRA